MLGLALAIDYSLFMVSRFREELRKGRDVETAVEITVATSGKAVTFSGLAVAIGLVGLLLFEPAALRSFGIGGSLVVAVVRPLRADVPAGRRSACSARASTRSARPRSATASGGCSAGPTGVAADAARESRWERMAHWVMARPVMVLIPTLALPALPRHAVPAPDPGHPRRVGPARGHREPRGVGRARGRLPAGRDVPDHHPRDGRRARRPTPRTSSRSSTTRRRSTRVDGVDRVEGPFAGLKDPRTGADLDAAGIAALFAAPRDQLPPELAAGLDQLEKTLHPGLRPSASTRSARSRRSARPAPRSSRPSAASPSTASRPRSAGSPPRARTSCSASRPRSRGRSP